MRVVAITACIALLSACDSHASVSNASGMTAGTNAGAAGQSFATGGVQAVAGTSGAGAMIAGAGGAGGTAAGGAGSGAGSAAAPAAGGQGGASSPGGGDAAVDAGAADGGDLPSGPALPEVTDTTTDGPFATMQDASSGPIGRTGLFAPSELGKDGLLHPVFVWGCGGGSTPAQYADQLARIASHGFIVLAEVSEIGDDGAPLEASIDWIIAENDRAGGPFHQKVNTAKIALGGHSIGSANSFLVGDDPRLTTTIHVAGGSLDDVNDPFGGTTGMGGMGLVHPVAYICSMSDAFGNVEKTERDYENTTVPAFMTVMTGVDHVGAARSGLPATIAWLRWHLAGETERRAAFLEAGGEFTTGIFVSRSKNW